MAGKGSGEAGGGEARQLGSDYVLGAQLGFGAMGRVFRGSRRSDGSPVAVKVLREEFAADPEVVARFVQERSILVGLEDPNLVRVRDLVVEGETLAIVMDLVDGADLRPFLKERVGRCRQAGRLGWARRCVRG